MKINFVQIFSQNLKSPVIINNTEEFFTIKFPDPYPYKTQIAKNNYQKQIDIFCSKKNIPFQIRKFVLNNVVACIKQQILMQRKTYLNKLYKTQSEFQKPQKIYQRAQLRNQKQKQQISRNVFVRVKKQVSKNKFNQDGSPIRKKRRSVENSNSLKNRLNLKSSINIVKTNMNTNTREEDSQNNENNNVNIQIESNEKYNIIKTQQNQEKSSPLQSKEKKVHEKLYQKHKQLSKKKLAKSFMAQFDQKNARQDLKKRKSESKDLKYIAQQCQNKSKQKNKGKQINETFFNRLKKEIQRRKKKSKNLIQMSTKMDLTTREKYFKPQINLNPQTKSRVYQSKNHDAGANINSSKQHRHPPVDIRSSLIIKTKQNQYFQSVYNKLFLNNRMVYNTHSIQKFDDQQFQILYPFLIEVQKDRNILHDAFMTKLINFYNKLGIQEKYYLKFLNSSSTQNPSQYTPQVFPYKPSINKRSDKMGDVYLKKINQFI